MNTLWIRRARPLPRPSTGLRLGQIPFVASQATQVPSAERERGERTHERRGHAASGSLQRSCASTVLTHGEASSLPAERTARTW